MKTAKVIFYLKAEKVNQQTGEMPIYARITVDGKRSNISINRWVHPNRWKETNRLEDARKMEDRELYAYMESIKNRIKEVERELLDRRIKITSDSIKSGFTGVEKRSKSLIEVFELHNRQFKALVESGTNAQGTLDRYRQSLNHVKAFLPHQYKIGDISLDEIKFNFIIDFDFYLRTERKCNNNSTIKYCRNLRTVINYAILNDWMPSDPFTKYKQVRKLNKVQRGFLTQEEIDKLESKVFSTERLNAIRDIFLFSIYTGYAYCDVQKLSPQDMQRHIDGEFWIFTTRQKTRVKENVMLLPPAMRLIEKYKNHPYCLAHNVLFPVPSNQKVNEYLKEIAELAGISKNLTFHLGRHTFATTILLANDVPLESVRELIGHENIRMTEHYAKMQNKKVSDDMKKLKEKFTGKNQNEKLTVAV